MRLHHASVHRRNGDVDIYERQSAVAIEEQLA